jgi:ribosome-associated heat shock protein Hsp15
MKTEARIDKWLWAMRLFKTRTIAAEACKKGRVMIAQSPAKPSRTVHVGDVIQIRRPPVTYSFKVLALTENRLGAKLVPEYMENVTTADQLALLELSKVTGYVGRDRGTGRPTKKERRDLDMFLDDEPFFTDEDLES